MTPPDRAFCSRSCRRWKSHRCQHTPPYCIALRPAIPSALLPNNTHRSLRLQRCPRHHPTTPRLARLLPPRRPDHQRDPCPPPASPPASSLFSPPPSTHPCTSHQTSASLVQILPPPMLMDLAGSRTDSCIPCPEPGFHGPWPAFLPTTDRAHTVRRRRGLGCH